MSEWWDKVSRGERFETWGIVFSEPVCRVLQRIAKSGENRETLEALEKLFRELPNGIPAGAKKVRADIPLYRLVVGPYRVTLAIKREQLWVDCITRLPEVPTPSTSN